jgi:hypothetical protein
VTDQEKPEADAYADERAVWNAFRNVYQSKGVTIDQLLAEWAAHEVQQLRSPGGRDDFDTLCQDGCQPLVLAAILALMRYRPHLESLWGMITGPPGHRQKATRTLEKAAVTVEGLFGEGIENEKLSAEAARVGRIAPSRLAAELRFYSRVINLPKLLAVDTEAHSLAEVAKYILAGYVERATSRPHDGQASGLIGEITIAPEYNEVAHRMWRHRNYDRLDAHFSGFPRFFVAMGVVIARSA